MSASLRQHAIAHIAPSASETRPILLGRAPIPPRLPIIPSVGAEPPSVFPSVPGTIILRKVVSPILLSTGVTIASSPRFIIHAATSSPFTGASRISITSITCLNVIAKAFQPHTS